MFFSKKMPNPATPFYSPKMWFYLIPRLLLDIISSTL